MRWQPTSEWEALPKDMKGLTVGDVIVHSTWSNTMFRNGHGYEVVEILDTTYRMSSLPGMIVRNYPKTAFTSTILDNEFSWYRKRTEIAYDPSQQGDTDDDI